MLAFFRRLVNSKVGLIITFITLALIALAFASGDVSSIRSQGLGALAGGDDVLRVGDTRVSAADFATRVDQEMTTYRQQQPTLDMAQFVIGGGLHATLTRLTNGLALDQFGHDQGMVVSTRAVDGQIASNPGLQGPNGAFDPSLFRQALAARKLTEQGVRADLARDIMASMLTSRLLQPQPVPTQLALPYANMSLEKRAGQIAFVPSKAMPTGAAPTDAELQAFYNRNVARYTVPERRTIRYARITPDQVKAQAVPNDAEIAAYYKANSTKYAATEKRSITQVVVLDQASANSLAAKVKGGAPLAAAASAAGLASSTRAGLTKAALAQQTSPALADAVFAAAKGAVIGPIRGGLGFSVAKVDAVEQVAGRSLEQARGEIVAALTKQKTTDALNALHDGIDDALASNTTFDEIVADKKLAPQTSPALLANGTDPDHPGAPDPTLAPLLTAAFQMAEGDEPQMVQTGADGSFALVGLGRVTPAAPRPLAAVRDAVTHDVLADRARQAARKLATQILQRANAGTSLAQAWAQAGIRAEPPHSLAASREDISRAQGASRAPLALLFAMAPGTTKLLEAPDGAGWAIIHLDTIQSGDASKDAPRIDAVRRAFAQSFGREYVEQFARAAHKAVGVTVNKDRVARVRAQLLGQGGGAQ